MCILTKPGPNKKPSNFQPFLLIMTNQVMEKRSITKDKGAFNALYNIAQILNTGLSREELILCIQLCEEGINPEMLAQIVREMKNEVESLKDEAMAKKSGERGY